MNGGVARVSMPAGVRRTIQNIKEIAGNHSDEEIYAMLKECAMDPNETAQKLLLEDTFHEVKRKHSKRKETVREPADPRWRPGVQGRGGRGGRGNYSSCSVPNDAAAGRNVTLGKDNEVNQVADKGNTSSSSITPDTENKSAMSISSSVSGVANGPSKIDHPISSEGSHVSGVRGIALREESSGVATTKTGNSRFNPNDVKGGSASGLSVPDSDQRSSNKTAAPVASASHPVLVPSLDTHNPAELGTIEEVTGIQCPVVETANREVASQDISGPSVSYMSGKGSSDMSNCMHGKMLIKHQGAGTNELSEKSQVASSSPFSGATGSRPFSTYINRSQHLSGLQKAPAPSKEWKPKSIHANPAQASEMTEISNVPVVAEAASQLLPASCSVTSEETSLKLEKKLEELKLSDRQHVIIPNHLQVPESERYRLSFGSFDANFELNMVFVNGLARDKIGTPLSESSQENEETIEQPSLSIDTASSAAQEAEFPDHPQSPKQVPDNYSTKEAGVSSSISAAAEHDQSKEEAALAPEAPQPSVVQSVPSYPSLGVVPQVLGSQFGLFESSESQARDTSRLPSFLVQQSYDPSASYYTQFYRPTADADGRISPFLSPGASSRYNGNIAVLPAQTGQASQESTNSTVLSAAASTPLATQAVGTMQGSVAIPQQPVPVVRQPAGLHLSHYPPNYIPFSQYFSPFYVPPPTLHHFLGSASFLQQPPTGSMYPTPGAATPANPVKYSLSQYKPGPNTGNSMIVGMPTGYGTYNSTPVGYTPGPAASSGNSTNNEDLGSSQFKENNVYVPGQQSEGSGVWIPAPGRDISTLQAGSFYSIPPQGQHMTFAPTQAGHGAFGGIYPPPPTVAASVQPLLQQSQTLAGAVEMVGPPAGVYQQPQRAQINWTNNY